MAKKKSKGKSAAFLRDLRRKHGLGEFSKSRSTKLTKRRGSRKVAKRTRSRRTSTGRNMSLAALAASGMFYGGVRRFISNILTPITSRVPLGAISDEVVTIGALEALDRFGFVKGKTFKSAKMIGQGIEFASIGQAIVDGDVNLGFLGGNSSSSNGVGSGFSPTLG